jgi:hypothetical protein
MDVGRVPSRDVEVRCNADLEIPRHDIANFNIPIKYDRHPIKPSSQ